VLQDVSDFDADELNAKVYFFSETFCYEVKHFEDCVNEAEAKYVQMEVSKFRCESSL